MERTQERGSREYPNREDESQQRHWGNTNMCTPSAFPAKTSAGLRAEQDDASEKSDGLKRAAYGKQTSPRYRRHYLPTAQAGHPALDGEEKVKKIGKTSYLDKSFKGMRRHFCCKNNEPLTGQVVKPHQYFDGTPPGVSAVRDTSGVRLGTGLLRPSRKIP